MKKINSKLSSEQRLILFEESTERPGSSELNFEVLRRFIEAAKSPAIAMEIPIVKRRI